MFKVIIDDNTNNRKKKDLCTWGPFTSKEAAKTWCDENVDTLEQYKILPMTKKEMHDVVELFATRKLMQKVYADIKLA